MINMDLMLSCSTYDAFKPQVAETVAAMCKRFDVLCLQLSRVGMAPNPRAAIQHLVKQLKSERPAWGAYLQGLWQVLPRAARLNTIQPGLVTQDSGLRQQLGQLEVDEADNLVPGAQGPLQAHAADVSNATPDVAARLTAIEDVLRQLKSVDLTGRPEKQKRCYRCGSRVHLIKDCKSAANSWPPASSMFASLPFANPWLLDSGTSHHMSTGNGAGAASFRSYRAFEVPRPVHFGKRGVTAPAVGIGDLLMQGCGGTETLRGVLYTPDLAVSLFSVRAAVHQGMAVSFRPGPGGACVVLQRDGHTIFTASEHGGLFYLDTQFLAAAAATGGVQCCGMEGWAILVSAH
jgi:hypothetical protein